MPQEIDDETKRAYMQVFNTEAGKIVLRDLHERFLINESSFRQDLDYNPHAAAKHDGMKTLVTFLLRAGLKPTQYEDGSREA